MKKLLLIRLFALVAAMMCALGAEAIEAYANYTSSNTTLTFYYDNLRSTRTGTTYDLNTGNNIPDWYSDGTYANVTKVVFNSSFANARPTSTGAWFAEMANLQTITGMAYLNTSEVTNMRWMFGGCSALTSLDVSNLNTAQVTNMVSMFDRCKLLTSLDLSHFNTAKVTDMSQMFYECNNLTGLNVSNFNTANVTNMSLMFNDCISLTSLDLSSFNTAKVAYMSWMLGGCGALRTIYVGDGWTTAAVQYSTNMFLDSYNLVGGKGTTYDSNHIDAAYAHIDGGSSNPGYFTRFVSLDEALNVAGGNIHFVSTGYYPWTFVQEGSRVYAQSGNKGVKSSVSVMTATVTVDEATTLSFDFKAWGESNSTGIFDYCAFFVDNDELIYYGARDNDWERFTVELSAGTHTLKWMYSKDSFVNPDGDYFAIDNVALGSGGLLGDVNNDGEIDVADVTALIAVILNGTTVSLDVADVNNDNEIDVGDVTALIAYVLSH